MIPRDTLYHFLLAHCPNEAAALADALAPLADDIVLLCARVESAWQAAAPHMSQEQRMAISAAMLAAGNADNAKHAAQALAQAAEDAPYL